MKGEFEKQVKKLCLDPNAEKELIDMINKATSEDQCMCCESKEGCENFKWHKKWLNTNNCNCCPHKPDRLFLGFTLIVTSSENYSLAEQIVS